MSTEPKLYDADTAERIGPATTEQVAASIAAGEKDGGTGIIRIDPTSGLVSSDGRRVYTDRPPAGQLVAENDRWLTAGELRAHLERFPDDMPVTVSTHDTGGDWYNVVGATDPYESGENSIILTTADDFDPRQW